MTNKWTNNCSHDLSERCCLGFCWAPISLLFAHGNSLSQIAQVHGLASMGGKAKGVGKRGIGSSKSRKTHKQGLRAQFESRHLDQIWEDVRKAVTVHDGKTAPVGTTNRYASLSGCAPLKHNFCYCCQPFSENCLYTCRAQLDEDLPAHGQHYCIPCRCLFIPDVCL